MIHKDSLLKDIGKVALIDVAFIYSLCDNKRRIAADVCGLSLGRSDASGLFFNSR